MKTEIPILTLSDLLPQVVDEVQNGDASAMEAYAKLVTLERMIADAKKDILNYAIDERELLGKEEVIRAGYKISVVSTQRFTYDDPEIDRYKALIKSREVLCKRAYKMENEGQYMYDKDGVVISPAIPKVSTTIKCERLPEDYHVVI